MNKYKLIKSKQDWIEFSENILQNKEYTCSEKFKQKFEIKKIINEISKKEQFAEFGYFSFAYYFKNKGYVYYNIVDDSKSGEYFQDMLWAVTKLIRAYMILKTATQIKDNSKSIEEMFLSIHKYNQFEKNFARLLRLICVLSIQTLESYINEIACKKLNKKEFQIFEKNSLPSKWLYFPKYISNSSFDVKDEPFLSFQNMVKKRNNIIHTKTKIKLIKVFKDRNDDNKRLKEYEKQYNEGLKSFDITYTMIHTLNDFTGVKLQDWLINTFEIYNKTLKIIPGVESKIKELQNKPKTIKNKWNDLTKNQEIV